jgi:hypothetical protein
MRRFHLLLLCLLIANARGLHAVTAIASATFTGGDQGRIVVEAKVNGKGPYPFVFDTGSINILSLDLANQLGIPVSGKQRINAFGGSVETSSAVLDSITLGDFASSNTITMLHSEVTVIGGGPFTNGGPVGFLGWQFLSNLVIEIDYERGRLNFYDPATYAYSGPGLRLPITLSSNFIVIPARVYGHSASLEIDSGNENSALVLFRRFVTTYQLHSNTEAVTGYGFGGLTHAMVTHTPFLEIGGFKIESPLTYLSLDQSGVEAGDVYGNLGAPILREFTWIYDVPHKSVYLQPNKWFHRPELADHSGLVLDTRGRYAKVLYVYPNSPAANAGIMTGDEVAATDGQTLTGDQWHDLLDAAAGTMISLRVNHQSRSKTLSLTLKAYM